MNVAMIIYVVVSLVAIGVLVYFYTRCKKGENFCGACHGIGIKSYPDRPLVRRLYDEGKLTEFTPRHKDEEWQGLPWDNYLQKADDGKGRRGCG